jgi:hypothetical protein
VWSLPDELLLPTELDPQERENRELRRQLQQLQGAMPKLTLGFQGCDPINAFFARIGREQDFPQELLESHIRKLANKYPILRPESLDVVLGPDERLKLVMSSAIGGPSEEEYTRYNQEREQYLSDLRNYYQEIWSIRNVWRRTIKCCPILDNTAGTKPAEDIDIAFHIPDGVQVFNEAHGQSIPPNPSRHANHKH